MHFLCSFRTVEQLDALRHTLERGLCQCARGPDALHKYITPAKHRSLLVFDTRDMHTLIATIDLVLEAPIDRQGRLRKLFKATQRSVWPLSMNEYLPDGSASLYNLVRWLPRMDADSDEQADHVVLICKVFESMPSYLRAGFMKGPILVDWLSRTMARWEIQPINFRAAKLPKPIASTAALLKSVCCLSDDEILEWLSGSPRHSIQDIARTLDRISNTMSTCPSHAASYEETVRLQEFYKMMLRRLIFANEPGLNLQHVPASEQETLRVRHANPVIRLGLSAYGPEWKTRCYGPGCIATYADSSKIFKKCSGCPTAVYCSRRCQAAAWRHPKAAHRQVCGLYRACWDAMMPHDRTINEAVARAWGALPRQQLDAASANIENLRATQLVCLSTCLLLSDSQNHTT
jgi:hypothetical protein